jgi:DNA-binding NtrC family response regulator
LEGRVSAPKATILIVDDDAAFAYTIWRFFEAKGFRVISANGSTQALQALQDNRFDIVVTDIKFGRDEPDGLELAAMIKTAHPSLPVICVTAYPEIVQTRRPAPGITIFYKPVELSVLRQAVEERLAA